MDVCVVVVVVVVSVLVTVVLSVVVVNSAELVCEIAGIVLGSVDGLEILISSTIKYTVGVTLFNRR